MPHIIEWESGSFNIILLPKLNVTWYKRCCWFECLCKVGFYYFDKNYYEDYMDATIFVNFCVLRFSTVDQCTFFSLFLYVPISNIVAQWTCLYRCLSSVYKWQLQKVMMSLITIHYYHSVNTQNHTR